MPTPSYLLNKYNRTLENPVRLVRQRIAIEGALAEKEAAASTEKMKQGFGVLGGVGQTYNEWSIAKKGGYEGSFPEYMVASVGSDAQVDEIGQYYSLGAGRLNEEKLAAKIANLHPKPAQDSLTRGGAGRDYSGLTYGGGKNKDYKVVKDPLTAGEQPKHGQKSITLGDYLNEPTATYEPKFDFDKKEVARMKHEGNKDFSKYGPEGVSKETWQGTYTEPGKLSPRGKYEKRHEDYELETAKYEAKTSLSEWNKGNSPLDALLDIIENFKMKIFKDKKDKK
jgi:hypothetical protein